jgi:hypothetical protein
VNQLKKQCPECKVTLTRYEWSRLWWVSSGMSGRLVQPCSACGALLRLSAMRFLTVAGALGLLASAVARVMSQSEATLVMALFFAVVTLVGMVSTRVETVMQIARESQERRSAAAAE